MSRWIGEVIGQLRRHSPVRQDLLSLGLLIILPLPLGILLLKQWRHQPRELVTLDVMTSETLGSCGD
jgi:hypothetical protein